MSSSKGVSKALIILSILLIPSIGYLILSTGDNQYQRLEIYGPKEPAGNDTLYHTIGDFKLISHTGDSLSLQNLKGKIFIADFFFATCQTICPEMSMQMKRVQEAYRDDNEILLVSHSVNPVQDTVEALAAYATEYEAIPGKWFFLTGDKPQIYDLARKSYFITAMEGDGGPGDFIHSEKLVLVDKEGRIRGYYDGTDYEDVNKLIDEIKVLKWEYKPKQ
jgi:protein SCO1